MKISTSKTKLHFSRTSVQCFLHIGSVSLKQVKFKYLGVTFKSDGRQDEELDVQSDKPCVVMRSAPFSYLKLGAIEKDKILDVKIDICPHPHLWS